MQNSLNALIFSLCLSASATAQTDSVKSSLVISGGGGLTYYVATPGLPLHLETREKLFGKGVTGRLQWNPGHLLNVAVETGYMDFYSYSFDDPGAGKLKVTAIPLLLQWSMNFGKRLSVYAGSGTYFVRSELDFDGIVRTSTVSLGWMLGLSYGIQTGRRTKLSAEAKWMYAAETEDAIITTQFLFAWNIVEW